MTGISELFRAKWDEQWNSSVVAKGFTAADVRSGGRATKANPDKENADWWLENGPKFVESWVDFRDGSGWSIALVNGQPAIELGLTVELGGLPVQMHIDRIMVMGDGELTPDNFAIVDLKTGSQQPKSDLQLAFYAAGLEKALGWRPRWGGYWMARTGTLGFLADLDDYPLSMVEDLVGKFKIARDHSVFLPNMNHCHMCSVLEFCKYRNPKIGEYK